MTEDTKRTRRTWEETERIWDRAEYATRESFREMDEFIAQCEPATNENEARKISERFIEILNRQSAKALEIGRRAAAGDAAPHLNVVK